MCLSSRVTCDTNVYYEKLCYSIAMATVGLLHLNSALLNKDIFDTCVQHTQYIISDRSLASNSANRVL